MPSRTEGNALEARLSLAYSHAVKTLRSERKRLVIERRRVSDLLKAQSLIQEVAASVQEHTHRRISAVVSRCLAAVFDDPYQFKIRFEKKRGKTDAHLVFVRNGVEMNPASACGGGVVDVAAFALRLACLTMQRPARRRLLVLDEPFRFVSERKGYRDKVRLLLEALAEEMNVQIVQVTHDRILEAGKVVEID